MTLVIGQALAWWAATTVVGLAAVPIARALLPTLPDRGLAFARPLGLLLVGYTWWILVTAGVLPNSRLGVLVALVLVGGAGLALAGADMDGLRRDVAARRRLIVGLELLFLVALVAWALYRAFYPDITESGGEKMMEMAFLSAIDKSPSFPPNDPWLSGHSISYYYFGYLIAAMLVKLTGLSRFVAYNLVVPMTFALTLSAAFSLGWSLSVLTPGTTRALRIAGGAVTATCVGLAGSLAGFLELAFMRGWLPAAVFDRLDIRNLTVAAEACGEPGSGFNLGGVFPSRFMWWWRTSRIIRDNCKDVIHEYPFFSFLLADVHPHVMALPYALLVLAIGLALCLGAAEQRSPDRWRDPVWWLVPLCVGALGFLNTWDLPTYGLVAGVGWVLWRVRRGGRPLTQLRDVAVFGVWLLGLAIILYLPFYGAFHSQAAGVGIARYSSRLGQWSVHFLPLAFLAMTVVGARLAANGGPAARTRLAVALGITAVAVVGWRWIVPTLVPAGAETGWTVWTPLLVVALTVAAAVALAEDAGLWTADRANGLDARDTSPAAVRGRAAASFALLCIAVGAAMAALPEFVYLKDVFDDRMNTVFKFFFQAWVLLGIGGGYALTLVWAGLPGRLVRVRRDRPGSRVADVDLVAIVRWVWTPAFVVLAAMALYTPIAAIQNRTDGLAWVAFRGPYDETMNDPTLTVGSLRRFGIAVGRGYASWSARLHLDGIAYWERENAEDLTVGRWLEANAAGTPNIVEAATGAYDRSGRIAMLTGFPTVLGSDNHESQWRGTREEIDPRAADVEAFYTRLAGPDLDAFLAKYAVRYAIVGGRERDKYPSLLTSDLDTRLASAMTPVFRTGQTTVWARKP